MDQEKQSVFISDGLRIADFIRFLFKNKRVLFIFLFISLSASYFYLQLRPTSYESSVVITSSDEFSNTSFINKYNYFVNEISNTIESTNLKPISNQKLFDQWLKIFKDRSVFEEIIKSLEVISIDNYESKLDYELALLSEINKIKLVSKSLNSFETKMWEKEMISLPYILSYKSDNQTISKQILIKIIDEINYKGKQELINHIDNMVEYVDFYTSTMIIKTKSDIEQIKIVTRNDILNEIEFLKTQSNKAEKLNILYPRQLENDAFSFVNNQIFTNDNRFYDGKIALDLEIKELENAIVDDETFNLYTEKLNLEKYLELEKLSDYRLKEELSNFRADTIKANIPLIYYNNSQINIKAQSSNVPIIMLVVTIFSFVMCLTYLYVRSVLSSDHT